MPFFGPTTLLALVFAAYVGPTAELPAIRIQASGIDRAGPPKSATTRVGTAFVLLVDDAPWLVSTYHTIHGAASMENLRVGFGERRDWQSMRRWATFTCIAPEFDLVAFRLSAAGTSALRGEGVTFYRAETRAVQEVFVYGNPLMNALGTTTRPFNYRAGATVGGTSDAGVRIVAAIAPQSAAQTTEILLLNGLVITKGYSGGPVVPSDGDGRSVAAMLVGGDPEPDALSWAVEISQIERWLDDRSASDAQCSDWPALTAPPLQFLTRGWLADSEPEEPMVHITQVRPSEHDGRGPIQIRAGAQEQITINANVFIAKDRVQLIPNLPRGFVIKEVSPPRPTREIVNHSFVVVAPSVEEATTYDLEISFESDDKEKYDTGLRIPVEVLPVDDPRHVLVGVDFDASVVPRPDYIVGGGAAFRIGAEVPLPRGAFLPEFSIGYEAGFERRVVEAPNGTPLEESLELYHAIPLGPFFGFLVGRGHSADFYVSLGVLLLPQRLGGAARLRVELPLDLGVSVPIGKRRHSLAITVRGSFDSAASVSARYRADPPDGTSDRLGRENRWRVGLRLAYRWGPGPRLTRAR